MVGPRPDGLASQPCRRHPWTTSVWQNNACPSLCLPDSLNYFDLEEPQSLARLAEPAIQSAAYICSADSKKRQGRPPAVRRISPPNYFRLTAFFNSAPGVNFATLRAAILMVAPVCGLRPLRAFLCETEKVPKPINATRSPLRRAAVTLSTAVSMAVVACALLISHAPAILSTRSALFIVFPRRSHWGPAETGIAFGCG